MRKGVFRFLALAGLLAALSACTTIPSPSSSSTSAPAARVPPRPAKPASATDAAPPEGAVTDDKYLLTGEAARELERGQASWYGPGLHGRRTASGERYDMYALTAAHKTLPFGTVVRVRSLALGREVEVRINDRGPFAPGRVIDVSRAAAQALGLLDDGVAEVSLEVPASTPLAAASAPVRKARRPTRRAAAKRP
ncbi:septal ring lytic transglycosylase RlpA family protein [Polaromonas jejuensis]|uniref:Endolytic peptidoglycan transglycosylase RlpA n=1 Tax=Polaromonas jejuensis TaxID=457502 RepID=A0ABW0QB33_9BURK|nr:septal ring lytic transglycosylase RlpA family protein [Polaromonas jejuensis]